MATDIATCVATDMTTDTSIFHQLPSQILAAAAFPTVLPGEHALYRLLCVQPGLPHGLRCSSGLRFSTASRQCQSGVPAGCQGEKMIASRHVRNMMIAVDPGRYTLLRAKG